MQKAPFKGLFFVPKVGIEPTLPKEHDFESCASTNSATSALIISILTSKALVLAYRLYNLTTWANSGISK